MSTTTYETRLFINNQFQSSDKTFDVHNAATGELLTQVQSATLAHVDEAVHFAQLAQPAWAALPVAARTAPLYKLADLIEKNAKELAELDALAMGLPAGLSAGFLMPFAAHSIRFHANLAQSLLGESSTLTPGLLSVVLRQPFGVTAGIIPWNIPVDAILIKLAPSVAAGNAIILKPSEKSPLSALYLGNLIVEAGFPPGVVQILPGAGDVGQMLAEHMKIRKISFTGSTRTGRLIAQSAAKSNLKNVSLELGGKGPVLVFEDANLDEAAPACVIGMQFLSGQACVANTRLYVHESIFDAFVEKFKAAFGQYTHGDPLAITTTQGPLADKVQGENVLKYIDIGKADGKLQVGGERVGDKGYFITPTIFTDVPDHSKLNKEEVFGPVVVIHKFKTEAEAIARANDSEYGLNAGVFTANIDRALRVAKALEAGTVTVNSTTPTSAIEVPFGGVKASGLGRELGIEAVKRWTEEKSVLLKFKDTL